MQKIRNLGNKIKCEKHAGESTAGVEKENACTWMNTTFTLHAYFIELNLILNLVNSVILFFFFQ